jgi:sRNA-binding regulator protein Hfq
MSGIFTDLLAAIVGTSTNLDIYLSNGVKLSGNLVSFDEESLLVSRQTLLTVVERRHVTTLVPTPYPSSLLKGGQT